MKNKTIILVLILSINSLAGCTAVEQSVNTEEIVESSAPERMSFTSPIMGDENNSNLDDLRKAVIKTHQRILGIKLDD